MEPRLIPIVTTAAEAEAVELVQTYTRRWPAQENAIRDWLIPLGIEIVCAQMTKTRVFAVLGGRDHVADLDLFISDDHAVDEQFDQLAFVFKAGLHYPTAHPLAKLLHGLGDPGQLHVFASAGFHLARLRGNAFQALLQFVPAPLVFF
jgi:hypothetical protein